MTARRAARQASNIKVLTGLGAATLLLALGTPAAAYAGEPTALPRETTELTAGSAQRKPTPLQQARDNWQQLQSADNGLALLALLLANQPLETAELLEARALASALGLRFPDHPVVRAQLGYFWFYVEEFRQARADFTAALLGKGWSAEQRRNLVTALASSAEAMGDWRGAEEALRTVAADYPQVLLRLGWAQLASRQRAAALRTGRLALSKAADSTQRAQAQALIKSALTPNSDPRAFRIFTRAYAHLRRGDDRKALSDFEAGFAMGGGKAFHYADAAYAAKRLSLNRTAAEDFRFALDLDEGDPSFAAQQTFGYRRETEVLERSFGGLLGSPYQAGALDVWQASAELFWQPPVIGYRDGEVVQVFARTFANLRNGDSGPVGAKTLLAGIGARYKPWKSQNVVVSAEKLLALGDAVRGDWLLRGAYSTGAGTDVQVQRAWWPSWQAYTDLGWYVAQNRLLVSAEARGGVAVALAQNGALTLLPALVAAGEYDSAAQQTGVIAAGPGINLRLWFGGDRYRAPGSWLELHTSYRWGSADRGQGPVVRATLWL